MCRALSKFHCSAVVATVLITSGGVRADVIYSNLGPGDSYDIGTAWIVGLGFPIHHVAEPFRVTGKTYRLDAIEVPIGLVIGDNEFFLFLMTDENGRPGEVIEAFHIVGEMGPNWADDPPIRVESTDRPFLRQGVRYWVAATATVETFATWNLNSTGDFGMHAQRKDDGPWTTKRAKRAAFRVSGTPIGGP
jgi:hypothetical protein